VTIVNNFRSHFWSTTSDRSGKALLDFVTGRIIQDNYLPNWYKGGYASLSKLPTNQKKLGRS